MKAANALEKSRTKLILRVLIYFYILLLNIYFYYKKSCAVVCYVIRKMDDYSIVRYSNTIRYTNQDYNVRFFIYYY